MPDGSPFDFISDLQEAASSGLSINRIQVAPARGGIQPSPSIPGTETFAHPWLGKWHGGVHRWEQSDIACYSVMDAVVSGAGNIWINGRLVTSPEIMPPYVAHGLGIAEGGSSNLHNQAALPIRSITSPCLVALGHGIKVYGHFLIELLFRILVGRRAFEGSLLQYSILLDAGAPDWLRRILVDDFGIPASRIEFFRPEVEQVALRHAILPTRPLQAEHFHPAAKDMLDEFLQKIGVYSSFEPIRRAFVARRNFHNPAAPHRICTNEQALIEIARQRHGFTTVAIDNVPWRRQITLFRDADIIIGPAGSGLHNALFSQPGSRLASIGFMNLVQSHIGSLIGQHNAFFTRNVKLEGAFHVDEEEFGDFIEAVCKK